MQGGKRMAVLAGCIYPGLPDELKGCINDVVSMKKLLISSFGFKENDIELLTDEPNTSNESTGANIKEALERMIKKAEDGDLLVFHFSGHGTLLKDKNHGAIIPSDSNLITDMDFRQLVNKIHHKATFTILADSCHSGGLIDQEKEQIGPSATRQNPITNPRHKRKFIPIETIEYRFQQNTGLSLNIDDLMRWSFGDKASVSFQPNFRFRFNIRKAYDNGILLSACQRDEIAIDNKESNPPHGKFSYAIMTVLKNSGMVVSNRQLVMQTRTVLKDTQHPCLYSSDENADTTFLLQRQANTN